MGGSTEIAVSAEMAASAEIGSSADDQHALYIDSLCVHRISILPSTEYDDDDNNDDDDDEI